MSAIFHFENSENANAEKRIDRIKTQANFEHFSAAEEMQCCRGSCLLRKRAGKMLAPNIPNHVKVSDSFRLPNLAS